MTSVLTSELAPGQTLEMPCNNLLTTFMRTADPATIGGVVQGVLFVDSVRGTAAGPGGISTPFQTCQQAINYAVAVPMATVVLYLAPGQYPAAIAIPNTISVFFHGWDKTDPPSLGGDITITGQVGAALLHSFENCMLAASNIAVANPADQDIRLNFRSCDVSSEITAFNANINYIESIQGGDIAAGGALYIEWDGYSWARTLTAAPTITGTVSSGRTFLDAGHDIYTAAIAQNGVAIGTTVFIAVGLTPEVRENDRIDVQFANPTATDCRVGVHQVTAGSVTVWLENLSRASTNFDEVGLFTIHHREMITLPVP